MKKGDRLEELLKRKSVSVRQVEELLNARSVAKAAKKIVQPKTLEVFRFGIVSDTHLCDKACALDELWDFYEKCAELGVKEVVHGGDLLTGINVYPGQVNDLVCFGVDDHIEYAVREYPKVEGIKTLFIEGNHESSYTKLAGVHVGKILSEKRDDLVYVGTYNAVVVLNGIRIMLQHMSGGSSYAMSYKLQRYISNLPAGHKPNIYVAGHLHSSLFMTYRNIMAFLPGAFQRANDFTTRLGLHVQLGGWVVEVEVANDKRHSIKRITPTFIPYF